ncbi:hypothetical protein C1S86_24260 [Vibrio parahaemolyticus]|nr:hypothetical protein [Vibrio parahaemolyticus]PMT73870.1 hypothetical protein C1S97_25180 [Vibrio parahaemolyticus]PMT79070.1 hypothetical protein C1S86_24260 [Vibrio parahaemolyticus]
MGLENWGGEKNATAIDQIDNAYVPKSEHERLKTIEILRKQWSEIANTDQKAIKAFIDNNISSPYFDDFIATADKKQAFTVTLRMSPLAYFQSQVILGSQKEHKTLGNMFNSIIGMIYKNQQK